jgi:hypothetical protein
LDAGNLNKNKKQQDKKEREEAECDDGRQDQDKINEQIDEVTQIGNCYALLAGDHGICTA